MAGSERDTEPPPMWMKQMAKKMSAEAKVTFSMGRVAVRPMKKPSNTNAATVIGGINMINQRNVEAYDTTSAWSVISEIIVR